MKRKAQSSAKASAKKKPAPAAAKTSPAKARHPSVPAKRKGAALSGPKKSVPAAKTGVARDDAAKPKIKDKPQARAKRPSGTRKSGAKVSKMEAVPKILFEREAPAAPKVSGPGQRYALGPLPVEVQTELPDDLGDLPEAYGSKRLFLAARDPHWLYAHWDFTSAQLREYNTLSADRHLILRVFVGDFSSPPCNELRLHPESRNWFVHVGRGGTKYVAELGYYREEDRAWTTVSRSAATLTPPDLMGGGTGVDFATIPADVPFEVLLALVQSAAKEHVPLAEAIQQLRASGYPGLPEPTEWPKTDWTPEQERSLAVAVTQSVSLDEVRRTWVGSLEITELLRRRLEGQQGSAEMVSSAGLPAMGLPGVGAPGSVSSPFGGGAPAKGFWFNVNAELVIYGATEPDAQVTLAGRAIRLRPDGTFSFRFALPDGQYELPAVAVSTDGTDQRQAELVFSRSTAYSGEVGTHPQDPQLKSPDASALE